MQLTQENNFPTLPLYGRLQGKQRWVLRKLAPKPPPGYPTAQDRKSTRLNSSHPSISDAVFCLKKKNRGGVGDGAAIRKPACVLWSHARSAREFPGTAAGGAADRVFFFLMIRRPPRSTLFPYTRSSD